jgi:hypothetical protein
MTSLSKCLLLGVTALALLAGATPGAAAVTGGRPLGAGDGGTPAPPHVHAWVKQTRKEWVAPVKETVMVGTDAKGKPIYETRIVKPGYWRTIVFYSCSCGATKQ